MAIEKKIGVQVLVEAVYIHFTLMSWEKGINPIFRTLSHC